MSEQSRTAPVIRWNGGLQTEAVDLLRFGSRVVVAPTKVGYIILAADTGGLRRKFDLKQRPRRKPAVVLCGSLDQLFALAETNKEIEAFYRDHWRQNVLMGCILPWRPGGRAHLHPSTEDFVMDPLGTSCFVVRFGEPGERIARELWDRDHTLLFASSANPSGRGNRGVLEGIGDRIASGADLIIEADDFIRSIQPDARSRYEQGVMVSFVNSEGELVPAQGTRAGVTPMPVLIRAGLSLDAVMLNLARRFPSWQYGHGQYY